MAYQEDIALMAHLMRRAGFGATRDELESAGGQGIRGHRRGAAESRDAAAGRRLCAAALSAGGAAAGRPAADGQRPLAVLPRQHPAAAGREDGAVLAPRLRHRQFQGRQLRPAAGADRAVPQERHGQLPRAAVDDLDQRDDDVLARQQPEPRHRGERELGPRAARAVQPRRRQLHRDRRPRSSRAFTGWTFETKIPRLPYGRFPWKFEYRPEDHDDGEKVFLGHKGRFNGEDILDIVVQQPACGRFICRHLYNFFVADEPQVPAWPIEAPRDQKAIDEMVGAFRDSKFDMKAVLRAHVQLRLVQERPLPARQVAGRGRRQHAALRRRLRDPEAGLWRAVDEHRLYGPGPAEPALGRGLAHRQGVDQQRLA